MNLYYVEHPTQKGYLYTRDARINTYVVNVVDCLLKEGLIVKSREIEKIQALMTEIKSLCELDSYKYSASSQYAPLYHYVYYNALSYSLDEDKFLNPENAHTRWPSIHDKYKEALYISFLVDELVSLAKPYQAQFSQLTTERLYQYFDPTKLWGEYRTVDSVLDRFFSNPIRSTIEYWNTVFEPNQSNDLILKNCQKTMIGLDNVQVRNELIQALSEIEVKPKKVVCFDIVDLLLETKNYVLFTEKNGVSGYIHLDDKEDSRQWIVSSLEKATFFNTIKEIQDFAFVIDDYHTDIAICEVKTEIEKTLDYLGDKKNYPILDLVFASKEKEQLIQQKTTQQLAQELLADMGDHEDEEQLKLSLQEFILKKQAQKAQAPRPKKKI